MIVVRREWTARLEQPARDWTARIATLRFQDRSLDGVGSSVWVVPVPSKDEAEFGVSDTHEPHWLYLSQLAQAAFSLNNTCVDAALLVSHIWPSQAHRMQAWVQAQPVAAQSQPESEGPRLPPACERWGDSFDAVDEILDVSYLVCDAARATDRRP
jgi:hypothetical protein